MLHVFCQNVVTLFTSVCKMWFKKFFLTKHACATNNTAKIITANLETSLMPAFILSFKEVPDSSSFSSFKTFCCCCWMAELQRGEMKRELSSAVLVCSQYGYNNQDCATQARSFLQFCHMGVGVQDLGPPSAAFTGSWNGSGTVELKLAPI